MNYYNENDPFAAEWLRQLISQGHIPEGIVDERDIQDVAPSELEGFTQCHFFAGIGGWPYALRLAGWPDSKPVWTGSCPCQPFSQAGKGKGTADERHLWPAFHHLIAQRRPPIVFGEQVASPDGRAWLDTVQADLEGVGFAVGAADLCAAGIGAPHIRQRLWFVAERLAQSDSREQQGRAVGPGDECNGEDAGRPQDGRGAAACGEAGRLADSGSTGLARRTEQPAREEFEAVERDGISGGVGHTERQQSRRDAGTGAEAQGGTAVRPVGDGAKSPGAAGRLADNQTSGRIEECADSGRRGEGDRAQGIAARSESSGCDSWTGPTNGFWRDVDWLQCRDGKWRPVEPGTFPLAHGIPNRVGKLRGYGNAIAPQVAQAFIEAYNQATRKP